MEARLYPTDPNTMSDSTVELFREPSTKADYQIKNEVKVNKLNNNKVHKK